MKIQQRGPHTGSGGRSEGLPGRDGAVIATIGTDADDAVVERAISIAREQGRRLILIDRSSESITGATPYNDLRGDDDYRPVREATVDAGIARREGRNELARCIETASSAGVDVGGWFPTTAGIDGIRDAIERFDGAIVVVSASVRDPGIGDRFRGVSLPALEDLPVHIELVE